MLAYLSGLRDNVSGPTVGGVVDRLPVFVSPKTNVKEVARLMKEHGTTAVLVRDGAEIAGIFTSKDAVLRLIAAQQDPLIAVLLES